MQRLLTLPATRVDLHGHSHGQPQAHLHGLLTLPEGATCLLIHPRLQPDPADERLALVAPPDLAILSIDLLTPQEAQFADAAENTPRLAQRLIEVLDLVQRNDDIARLPAAAYCSGSITPALIRAAAQRDTRLAALACHGGQPERAGKQALELLAAPFLLLVDSDDPLGAHALDHARPLLKVPCALQTLAPATHPEATALAWLQPRLRSSRPNPR